MSHFDDLLEATIGHLQNLKRDGVKYLPIADTSLQALGKSAPPAQSATAQTRPDAPRLRTPAAAKASAEIQPLPATRSTPPAMVVSEQPIFLSGKGDKGNAMAELRERALVCQKCPHLAATRKNVVFGVGDIDAQLMFVGEAPGADEVLQGEPFVGRAGQLLTKIIQTMGLSREKVYIANILKCRPDTPGQSYGNRAPSPEEMKNCLPYLHAQIDLIKPKIMVALGATAVDGLFGKTPGMGITKLRGQIKDYRSIPVMLTYHPSYLLRPNVNNVKREVWEDMLKVMEFLNLSISEKQRGYFLNQ